jgi:hypothetical protein
MHPWGCFPRLGLPGGAIRFLWTKGAAWLREPSENKPEERVAVDALRERSWASDQLAVDEPQQRPERGVLCECKANSEASLLDAGPPLHEVERKTEEGAVGCVHREAAGEPDVGVVATE